MKALCRAALVGALAIALVGMGLPLGSLTALAIHSVPTIDVLTMTPSPSDEGQDVVLHLEFSDADALELHTITVQWGGVPPVLPMTTVSPSMGTRVLNIQPGPSAGPHSYPDDRPSVTSFDNYTVTVTIWDGTYSVTGTITQTVRNVAPTITAFDLSTTSIADGDTVRATGSFSDPGKDTFTLTLNWGDLTEDTLTYANGASRTFDLSHVYAAADSYVLTLTIADDDAGTVTATRDVAPTNRPPTDVSATADTVVEDDPATLLVTFADPDAGDTHTVAVDWGDGATEEFSLGADVLSLSAEHVYTDPGTYLVAVNVTDAAGESATGSVDVTVLVRNHAPTNLVLVAPAIGEGDTATLAGAFSDPDPADTHEVVVDWGDGSSSAFTLGSGVTTFSDTHPYSTPGTYALNVTVTDSHGASTSGSVELTVRAKTVAELLDQLARLVRSWGLDDGTENSLISKIDAARDNWDDNDPDGTCSSLNALGNHVSAQTAKKLSIEMVEAFWSLLTRITDAIPCGELTAAAKYSQRF